MYEGEGLGRLIIDLDALLGEAMAYKGSREDVAFPLGMALWNTNNERLRPLVERMDLMWRLANEDEPSRDPQT